MDMPRYFSSIILEYGVIVLWVLMFGGCLFLLSDPNTSCFVLAVTLGRKEKQRDERSY